MSYGHLTSGQQAPVASENIDVMIGQMIMIGVGDFNVAAGDEALFKEIKKGKVGGVVLYEKNISAEDPKVGLARLVTALQKNAAIPLFVSIDEEGGKVSRMKPRYGFPKTVSAQYLGALDRLDSTRFYALQTAQLLSDLGINMNYAPVVDVNLNPTNPVIGQIERSYSERHEQVVRHAKEVIKAHHEHKVVPVLKHFPGHGSSQSDTHLGLTDVSTTWQLEEIYPYKALIDSGYEGAIMTAHIVNRSLDPSKRPATLSKKVITGVLRDFLQFEGVIISDDMQMGAIANEYGLEEAIKMSLEAGVDLLMFANNVRDDDRVSASTIHAIIKELWTKGSLSMARIEASYKRIMKLKKQTGLCDPGYLKTLKMKQKAYE